MAEKQEEFRTNRTPQEVNIKPQDDNISIRSGRDDLPSNVIPLDSDPFLPAEPEPSSPPSAEPDNQNQTTQQEENDT